ncbi:MAG: septum formation initiator family protein [Candidatus Marinimicrobia bacterium]|nr:septum formation initiator family protein [Candidatus Neomarinimicrobiota bacterium]
MVYRQKNSSPIDANVKAKIILIIILICLSFLLLNKNGTIKLFQEKHEHQVLIERKEALEQKELELQEEKEKLQHDEKHIEKIAREQYNMIIPGEKVYKVIEEE